jgi:serine O-acetyltransferase
MAKRRSTAKRTPEGAITPLVAPARRAAPAGTARRPHPGGTGAPMTHLELARRLLAVPDARMDGGLRGPLPSAADAADLAAMLMEVLFPTAGQKRGTSETSHLETMAGTLVTLEQKLEEAIYLGLHRRCRDPESDDHCRRQSRGIARRFLGCLPDIRGLLVKDVEAALESDPAATGPEEVIACYPGLYAISIYRAANRLLHEGALIVPRMLTEHAKSRTGIDIHPGATIGASFFIDHGTGIVIGETTRIGNSVRIYQGVTLGALSIKRRVGRGEKNVEVSQRHPTIEDDVIIYANATILGGDTVIGRGAIIGGNSFITYSVPPGIRAGVGR